MVKKAMFFLGILLMVSSYAYGQEKFTVSGEIYFYEEGGEFHVWLKTQEERKRGEPVPPARSLLIKPNPQQLKAKNVPFKFVDVPKGIYCIYCIQDLNKNGKLDFVDKRYGSGPPIEPYGYSRAGKALFGQAQLDDIKFKFGPAQWDDIKFKVDENISGIAIEM